MARNGKEKIVIEWWEVRELLDQQFGHLFCSGAFPGDSILGLFRKELIGKFTKPSFEHRANNVDIIQVVLLKQVDVVFYKRSTG